MELKVSVVLRDKFSFEEGSFPFVHFMIQILFHKSNDIYTVLSFKMMWQSVHY